MTSITLHPGDNRASLRRLIDQGVRVHSVVSDPPYGLTSIAKRFGGDKAAPAKFGTDGAFARASAGFMGSKWDGTGIERDPEFWKLIYDILLPGGYVVAFSGSRTGHWQACAMELAGFVMHPFLGWVYGQGFPKAHNASKAIDKVLGPEHLRETTAELYTAKRLKPGATVVAEGGYSKQDVDFTATISNGGDPRAQEWDGWAYGGQALKPALEPIYVGQKPFSEKNGALNLLKHGVGAINIDGCRVPGESTTRTNRAEMGYHGGNIAAEYKTGSTIGRHPANLLHDGSPEVVALFPDSKGQLAAVGPQHGGRETVHCYGDYGPRPDTPPRNDSGSAARFFNSFGYSDIEEVMRLTGCSDAEGREIVAYLEQHRPLSPEQPTFYHGKATKVDRAGSDHPTVKPVALMQWLVRLVTPVGGTVLDPFAGSGSTGEAARREGFDCILMEAEDKFIGHIRQRFDLPSPTTVSVFDDILGADNDDGTDILAVLG